jgi:hypothetical protein
MTKKRSKSSVAQSVQAGVEDTLDVIAKKGRRARKAAKAELKKHQVDLHGGGSGTHSKKKAIVGVLLIAAIAIIVAKSMRRGESS